MARCTWLGAALLATSLASQAKAQAVIQEPGYCAQFYPNANCQNKGPGNPYTDPNYHRDYDNGNWQNNRAQAIEVITPRAWPQRHHHHRMHKHPQ